MKSSSHHDLTGHPASPRPLTPRRPDRLFMVRTPLAISLLIGSSWPLPAIAIDAAATAHEHASHGAHSHGSGTLDVALNDHTLMVELRVPAAHVVGFEHAPRTPAQHAAIDAAIKAASKTADWLQPEQTAQCTVQDIDVHLGGEHDDDHAHHHDDTHAETHADTHADAHTNAHTAHHDTHRDAHQADSAAQHSDYEAIYTFECASPDALTTIRFTGFAHLHGIETLAARFITPAGQGAQTLHGTQDVLQLTP